MESQFSLSEDQTKINTENCKESQELNIKTIEPQEAEYSTRSDSEESKEEQKCQDCPKHLKNLTIVE